MRNKSMAPSLALLLSLLQLCAAMLAACPPALAQQPVAPEQPAGSVFRVHPEKTFQTMTGFGCGFNEKTFQFMNAINSAEERAHAYDLLYGDSGVHLNIVRMTISPEARQLSGPHGPKYDWASDPGTVSTWKAIEPVLKRCKPILYAVPFTPPARWKNNGQLTQGGKLLPQHYQEYAQYLADFLDFFRKTHHLDIDVLSLQNEPGISAPWPSCLWSGQELCNFIKVLAAAIRKRGLSTKLMLSEGTAWSGAWDHLEPTLQDKEAHPLLSIMASHSYGDPMDASRKKFALASARNGLPVWTSEMSIMFPQAPDDPGMNTAMRIAEFIHRDLVEAHVSAWLYCFAIFTATKPWSLAVLSPADKPGPTFGHLVVPKRHWTMANYSHFIQPGFKLMQIDGSGPASTGFMSPSGDRFVIVALNNTPQPQTVSYDFGNLSIGPVEAFVTSSDLDLARVKPPANRPHGFSKTLLPMSVTTFVLSPASAN